MNFLHIHSRCVFLSLDSSRFRLRFFCCRKQRSFAIALNSSASLLKTARMRAFEIPWQLWLRLSTSGWWVRFALPSWMLVTYDLIHLPSACRLSTTRLPRMLLAWHSNLWPRSWGPYSQSSHAFRSGSRQLLRFRLCSRSIMLKAEHARISLMFSFCLDCYIIIYGWRESRRLSL